MALDQLEKLGLAWNKGVTDDALDQLCGAMGGLRELDLALCNKITARSLQVRFCHNGDGRHRLFLKTTHCTRYTKNVNEYVIH